MKIAILLIHELFEVEESLMPPSAKTLIRSEPTRSFRVCSLSTSNIRFSAALP